MRHKHSGRKLGRRADHRKAMLANLTESLITHGRIETTVTRAKEVRRLVEKLVTIARRGDLHSRRLVAARLHTQDAVKKLMDEIAPRYLERAGGYTRIIKTGFRRGDASPLAILEFVGDESPKKKKKAKPAKKKAPEVKVSEETVAETSAAETVEEPASDATTEQVPSEETGTDIVPETGESGEAKEDLPEDAVPEAEAEPEQAEDNDDMAAPDPGPDPAEEAEESEKKE